MNCPHCQAPVSTLSLLTQIGGTRPCAACGHEFVVTYNWTIAILTALAGFALIALGLTFFTSGQLSGEVVLLAGGAILTVVAIAAARAEKPRG